MRRILKAVVENTPIGDVSTLEDETAVEEVIKSFREQSAEQKGNQANTIPKG